jgi:hypothetical protein
MYAVVRVYNLEKQTEPGFTIYVDPWAMHLKDELTFLERTLTSFLQTLNVLETEGDLKGVIVNC